jgi:single-stranded-DNA-specific exonuclease
LAKRLQTTNKIRQDLTESAVKEAKKIISSDSSGKLIFITQEQLHEGIIGLIASRLVDEFFLPAVVISQGKKLSKASARSIPGFDLTEAIQNLRPFLVDGGGHPLAAGFTVETKKIARVKKTLMTLAEEKLDLRSLKPSTSVDFELHPNDLDWPLWEKLKLMQPFGVGNPNPTFLLKSVAIKQIQWVGRDHQHLKFLLAAQSLGAIGFYFRDKVPDAESLNPANLIFTLTTDTWNNQSSLLLKLKAIWT